MNLTQEQIEAINDKCPYNQGIFKEPYGIPNNVKELVIYSRYAVGGMKGGSCWDTIAEPYEKAPPKDRMKVLELVMSYLKPELTFLQFRVIEDLMQSNEEREWEYYGNKTDWVIEYITLSDLYKALEEMN